MKFKLSIFNFIACAFVAITKIPLPNPGSRNHTPVFSSKRKGVQLRSLQPLGDRSPTSFFCMWKSIYLRTICWRECSFPIRQSWHPYWKSIEHKYMGLFLFYWPACLSLCQYHAILITVAFVVNFQLRSIRPPTVFFFKIALAV